MTGELLFDKIKQYTQLTKFKVDIIVAITAVFGYIIGSRGMIDWLVLAAVFTGGFLVTATAHIINQLIETRFDRLMLRTAQRPLVTQKIRRREAIFSSVLMSVSGLLLLYIFVSPYAAFISLVSLIMYAFIYTPMKQLNRLAIWIGAIPGALPVLIGYVGATGQIDLLAILLFVFQVFWQLPHFWSIAWSWHDEYNKAGYDLLPVSGGKTTYNAAWTALSVLPLLPLSYLFYEYHYVSTFGLTLLLLLSLFFMFRAYRFYRLQTQDAAKKMTLASIIYLPIIQLILLFHLIH
jgi:protoheme IX farnesyltransferase